jgi:glycosyltransferase involved in cell wall biosynthesis
LNAHQQDDSRPVLALLPWGHLIEDFLFPNNLSIDDFCDEFVGSFVFGYVEALRSAGVETVIICISATSSTTVHRIHRPSGAQICILPAPRAYRFLRSMMRTGYARNAADAFALPRAVRLALLPLLTALNELAAYLSTPIRKIAAEMTRYGCTSLLCQEYEFPRFDVCVLARRVHRLPVFATFQGGDYQRYRLERILRPFTMRHANGFIVAPNTEARRLESRYRVAQRKVARIPNPIDLDTWRPRDKADARRALGLAEETLVAAWHGRIQLQKKGLDVLLEAWRELSKRRSRYPIALLLIGDGEDASEVHARIDAGGLERVTWIDHYVHEPAMIASMLSAADVYAFSSRHEGFAVAPVEAMACGLPVVATDVTGIRDVLLDGEQGGGIIVPQDNPTELALHIGMLFDDKSLRMRLAEAARLRAEEFGSVGVGSRLRAFLFDEAAS